jgi:DNA polymerase-3 subunit gamma/tau
VSAVVPAGAASPAPAAAARPASSDDPWTRRIEALKLEGMVRQLARHCGLAAEANGQVLLVLDARARHLHNEERRAAIEHAFSLEAGRAVQVTIELGPGAVNDSPAALEERRLIERQRDAEAAIEADPEVQAFKQQFGAVVRPGSVRPID